MAEVVSMPPLDLGDPYSVSMHRDALAANLPQILYEVGADEQAGLLVRGEYGRAVEWFTTMVSVGNHGIADGGLNLTTEQTRVFTPHARYHGLIAPTAELWTPGDDLPEGVGAGDIKDYRVEPDYESLPPMMFQPDTIKVVAGATFSGLIGRINSGIEIINRTPDGEEPHELVVLTGMRSTMASEGDNGLYKQYVDVPAGLEVPPIEQLFPAEVDSAEAILRKSCRSFELVGQVEDPQAGQKDALHTHPTLGSREWIARYYDATLHNGKRVRVTVVNGEPVWPSEEAMNRSKKLPAPYATETFKDWLKLLPEDQTRNIGLCISFAHLARIGAELRNAAGGEGLTRQLGAIMLAGNMPQPAVYDKLVGNFHNGGTMGFKEMYPLLKALNIILGREPGDFSIN